MYAAIAVGVIIIGMSIFFVYSSEQATMRGQAFSKAIEFLQEDLRNKHIRLTLRSLCLIVEILAKINS